MKKIFILVLGIFFMLTLIETTSAQNRLFKKKKPVPSMRGKANARELGREVTEALQTGNTNRLVVFAPNQEELKSTLKNCSAETAEIVKPLDAAKLEQTWAQDLELVKNQLAAVNISPDLLQTAEITGGRPKPKTPEIIPVTIKITIAQHEPVLLTFDALKFENRLFLLRHLTLQKGMQAAVMP